MLLFRKCKERILQYLESIDPGTAATFFLVSGLVVFITCFTRGSLFRKADPLPPPRRSSESHPKRIIPPQPKNGKRKRRFAKKDIKQMETEERNRRREEKREESKLERDKQKKADGGHQKQNQKTALKNIGSRNSMERQRVKTGRNVKRN